MIEISLMGLILEIGEEGHKKTEHSNLRSLTRLLQRCFKTCILILPISNLVYYQSYHDCCGIAEAILLAKI